MPELSLAEQEELRNNPIVIRATVLMDLRRAVKAMEEGDWVFGLGEARRAVGLAEKEGSWPRR